MPKGLTVGHEPVGVIEKLGSAVQGYREGQRVIAGAITPSGHSNACLSGVWSQDGVDVAIEALGTQATFESCLRVLRPGGTLSSLGVYPAASTCGPW